MSQIRYIALTLFFVPPLLLLTALDFDGKPLPVIKIKDVCSQFSTADFSGEACLSMCLGAMGKTASPAEVFERSGLNPALGRGCNAEELPKAAESIGFRVETFDYSIDGASRWSTLCRCWRQISRDLKQGMPLIVHAQSKHGSHFLVVGGYDPNRDEVIVYEPTESNGGSTRVDRNLFLNRLAIEQPDDQYSVFCLYIKGFQDNTVSSSTQFTEADFAKHVAALKKKLPNENFHIVIQKPFVVIGDESPAVVEKWAKNTVKWAVDRLKQDFFTQDPQNIIDIWLFKDKKSYELYTEELLGSKPHTPYGFYSSTNQSLMMNISTGGGTLVHEIVHPFIESNFPNCPSWFNEGLASLYEQCRDNDNRIWGSTNWRLRGLQLTIEDRLLPSFKDLCNTSTREFYDEDPGSNYGQARYLCFYLQEQNKLVEFYRSFRKDIDTDPTGYSTLVKTLGNPDMGEFQKEWEQYVLGLRFPN